MAWTPPEFKGVTTTETTPEKPAWAPKELAPPDENPRWDWFHDVGKAYSEQWQSLKQDVKDLSTSTFQEDAKKEQEAAKEGVLPQVGQMATDMAKEAAAPFKTVIDIIGAPV